MNNPGPNIESSRDPAQKPVLPDARTVLNVPSSPRQKAPAETEKTESFFVFKCAGHFFALKPAWVGEVTPSVFVHRIPHRSGNAIEGISNINGDLVPVVSVANAFKLDSSSGKSSMMVLCHVGGEKFAFETDSIEGMFSVGAPRIKEVSEGDSPFIANKFDTDNMQVWVIDVDLLAGAIARRAI